MRAWFMGRHAREKLLLLIFLGAAAVLWSSDLIERLRAVSTEVRITSTELKEQALWLADRERIEAEARAAVADLDSSRTFNSVRLSAELSTIAKQTNISPMFRSSAAGTEETAQFSVHGVDVRLTRVPWDNLLAFYDELSQRAPYISMDQFQLSAVRSDPNLMNAQLKVSSVEIAQH